MSRLSVLLLVAVINLATILPSSTSFAKTWDVPSEIHTIQAAIDSASSGDSILVAAGLYSEQLTIADKDLILMSSSGRTQTFLSGGPTPNNGKPILFIERSDSEVRGFSFEDGGDSTGSGGAVHATGLIDPVSVVLADNDFRRNFAYRGGAIDIRGSHSTAHILRSRFQDNEAIQMGGAINVRTSAVAIIRENIFERNIAFNPGIAPRIAQGGAIGVDLGADSVLIELNVFSQNEAGYGGGIGVDWGRVIIRQNTLVFNKATRIEPFRGAGIHIISTLDPIEIEANIISHNLNGWGVTVASSLSVTLQCNDVWGNDLGNYSGLQPGVSDFSADPLFCRSFSEDFTLASDSPCLPQNSGGCGLVGALGMGCAPTPVVLQHLTVGWEEYVAFLRWEVTEATQHAGFHIYRGPDTGKERLTEHLLAGRIEYEFIDESPPSQGTEYWLAEISRTGETTWHGPAVLPPGSLPARVALSPPAPNPFTSETRITYSLPRQQHVSLAVFDLQGRRIATLVDKDKSAGEYTVSWDGNPAASGLYILKLQTGEVTKTQKVMLVR